MQLPDRSGICCDFCGMTYKLDFTYYSFDFRIVSVYNNQRPSIDSIHRLNVLSSADVCTNCFDNIKKEVIKNYSKTMSPKRRDRVSPIVTCEITGKPLMGTYDYYYCTVSKVDIKLSGQPSVCVKCKTKTFNKNNKCSKCSGTEFVTMASSNVDNRFVEINISQEAFKDMVLKTERVRASASQWATKS